MTRFTSGITARASWLASTLALFLVLLGLHAPLAAQAPPDLGAATTASGLSIHQDFYEDLNAGILSDNAGRSAAYTNAGFTPHTDKIEEQLSQIEGLFQAGYDAAISWLTSTFPEIGLIVVAIVGALLLLFCGSFQPTVDVGVPPASVVAAFTVEDMQIAQTSTGQRFTVRLGDVGLRSIVETEVGIGSCTDESKDELAFVYPAVNYRVDVQFLAGGGTQVTAQLLGALPGLVKTFDGGQNVTADALWTFANVSIGGSSLQTKIAAFATNDVPDRLEEIYTSWFVPYLAQAGWRLDLSGSKQTTRYGENQVFATVGPALYAPLASDLAASKVRVEFDNVHSSVPSHALATCANPTPFDPGPAVAPNFAAEGPTAEGTYHTSYKTFEHRIVAGIRSAVGLRDELKPGSDYIVEHDLITLVPEATNSIFWMFRNVASKITPIPLSSGQANSILSTPAGQGQTLGQIGLGELTLRIRVCEVERPTLAAPFGPVDGTGMVEHGVVLRATIERGTTVVLQETFDATFLGELRLSKVPGKDSLEFRTLRADLVSLVNSAGLEWDDISTSTPFASAPVSLFLRAFLGDNTVPYPLHDQRIHYLFEGLVGPLVERAAHGMVVLPGLDFPAFNGAQFGFLQSAVQYYGSTLGLDFDYPKLCATVLRWGQTLALVNGVPSGTDFMLTVEVAWGTSMAPANFKTGTGVSPILATAPSTPSVLDNPSRWDGGYLSVDYFPTNGDESRVMNASGHRLGDFLPGGGEHFVAATAVAYQYLRQAYPAAQYPNATFELRPYRALDIIDCSTTFPGPVHEPPHVGSHHETGPDSDVYEALTFETRKDCLGVGKCDGARVVALWSAPLFQDCPENFGVDKHVFDTLPGTLRVPPSSYVFAVETCSFPGVPSVGEPTLIRD
jgi:hypothetical protein